MIYQISDVTMSISTLVLVQGAFLNISFEPQIMKSTKLGQLIDISKDNNFQ